MIAAEGTSAAIENARTCSWERNLSEASRNDAAIEPASEIYMAIGKATLAASGIEGGMVFLLGAILAPVPSSGHAAELASVFVYTNPSLKRQIEMINDAWDAYTYKLLARSKYDNERRSAEFITKAMGRVFHALEQHKWVRNFAAHGSLDLSGDIPLLIPSLYDYKTREKMKKKGISRGLSADQIISLIAPLSVASGNLFHLAHVMKLYIQPFPPGNQAFLAEANELANKLNLPPLKLQDPTQGRPMRQSKARPR